MLLCYDEQKCIGCGLCQIVFPEVWSMNKKNGKAELLEGQVKKNKVVLTIFPEDLGRANESMKACPTKAITII